LTTTSLRGLSLVYGHDNDSFVLGPHTRKARSEDERRFFDWRFTAADGEHHPATCRACGRKVDSSFVSPEFQIKRKRFDFSATYDGYTIASSRFRDACTNEHAIGLHFDSVPHQAGFFFVRATRVLSVDRGSPGLRLLYPCSECNSFAGVFGTSLLRFQDADPEAPGWWRSDLEFAQAHEQSPLFVVGEPTAKWLTERRFKGLVLKRLPG
jgi:hypothetical protein